MATIKMILRKYCNLINLTIIRQIIVHSVRPHIPDTFGDVSITFSMMLIITSTRTTSIPILPGYASGGIRKLSQLTSTMMVVGM